MSLHTVELVGDPPEAFLKIIWNVLKHVSATDTQTTYLSKTAEILEDLGNFTNTTNKSDFEEAIGSTPYDMFFYFGHGDTGCLFDETGYCTIYPDSDLVDKWVILTACYAGFSYARKACRDHGAIAAMGYAQPLAAKIGEGGFADGFDECFTKAQKVILDRTILDKDALMSAYEKTVQKYTEWSAYYENKGESLISSLFYADSISMMRYSKWDTQTTIDIEITPTPAEIYHFGNFAGMAPLSDYSVVSGGNVFYIKAIGCFPNHLMTNVPKDGRSYSLTPTSLFDTTTLHFESQKIYVEIGNKVMLFKDDPGQTTILCMVYNYGDASAGEVAITNSKNWSISFPISGIPPHSSKRTSIIVNKMEYTFKCTPQFDAVKVIVRLSDNTSKSATVSIEVAPDPACSGPASLIATTAGAFASAHTELPAVQNYNRMSATDRIKKNIVIGRKMYSAEDLLREIREGSIIGAMFI